MYAARWTATTGINPHAGVRLVKRRGNCSQSYLLRMGWLDGWAGLHASCLSALATYLREAMLWELSQPAVPQRIVVRDSWQGLKLFDPGCDRLSGAPFSYCAEPSDEASISSYRGAGPSTAA